MISQNLSPNLICCLGDKKFKNLVLITSVDPDKHAFINKRAEFVERVKKDGALFLSYPPEVPDNTLLRITGPMIVFCLALLIKNTISQEDLSDNSITKLVKNFWNTFNTQVTARIPDNFIDELTKTKKLVICGDFPGSQLLTNLRMKMIEGPMLSTHTTDYINFSHGTYQFIENTQDYCVWFVTREDNKLHKKTVELLNCGKERVHTTFYTDEKWLPIEL